MWKQAIILIIVLFVFGSQGQANGQPLVAELINYDIDNSLSERSIRPFTVGRSACKGFTSEEGVMIAARFYTLVETCKLNGVSPRDYFVKVLEALTDDYGDYEKLTPNRINEI